MNRTRQTDLAVDQRRFAGVSRRRIRPENLFGDLERQVERGLKRCAIMVAVTWARAERFCLEHLEQEELEVTPVDDDVYHLVQRVH